MPTKFSALIISVAFLGAQSSSRIPNDSDPAYSPDGKTIVFMSDRDGDIEIYRVDVDGPHLQRLTHAPGRDAHPAFSRDGKKIAFQSPREGGQPQIYVMNADGSDQKRLTNLVGFSGVPDRFLR